jgi:catechol 2,3-dioxygenase-like lactoylglutathione lyase family enzyme
MDFKLELVIVPVSDVDRAKAFYADTMGFHVDVDHRAGDAFRVVQLTPPGSACSITIGTGLSQVTPGTYQGLHLIVTDIEAARAWLVERGAEVSQPFHFGPEGQAPGVSPARANYETFLSLSDPDGNGWVIQEVGHQAG